MENKNCIYTCKLSATLGFLNSPDGSAIFSEGNTTVIAGIYGPVEVKIKNLLIDKASVECQYRPKRGLPGIQAKMFGSIIRNICETSLIASLYPRTAIVLTIQEVESSGQVLSCAINAACLACLNAGIDMKFMFGSVACYLNLEEKLSFDPFPKNETKAEFTLVFDSIEKRIIASHTKGQYSTAHFEEAIGISKEAVTNVFEYFKNVLFKFD